jgi:hypothetical protein
MKRFVLSLFMVALTATLASAAMFEVGSDGGGPNQWPSGEVPSFAIDGFGQKYLNFGKEDTGVVVTPGAGSTVTTGITLFAANDSPERDPASFSVYGTNDAITAANPGDLQGGFTLIASDLITLPDTRNDGGGAALDPANSTTASFSNADAYTSYMVIFPTLKDSDAANSMQVAEIQLLDATGANLLTPNDAILGGQLAVPEPTSLVLLLIGAAGLFVWRRGR